MRKVILMCAAACVATLPVFGATKIVTPGVAGQEAAPEVKKAVTTAEKNQSENASQKKGKNLNTGKMLYGVSDEEFTKNLENATPEQKESWIEGVDEIDQKRAARKLKASSSQPDDINLEDLFESKPSKPVKPIKKDIDLGIMYDEDNNEVKDVEYQKKEVNWDEQPSSAAKASLKAEKKARQAEAKKVNYGMSQEERENYLNNATDEQLDAFFEEAEKNGDQVDQKKAERKRKKEAKNGESVKLDVLSGDESSQKESAQRGKIDDQSASPLDISSESFSSTSASLPGSLSSNDFNVGSESGSPYSEESDQEIESISDNSVEKEQLNDSSVKSESRRSSSSSEALEKEIDSLLIGMEKVKVNLRELGRRQLEKDRLLGAVKILVSEDSTPQNIDHISRKRDDINPVSD